MNKNEKKTALENLKAALQKLTDRTFTVYFFVYDTKGIASGSLSYIYETALILFNMGYNVKMIHNEEEFVGVEDWLGEKYSSLPHSDLKNLTVSPSDFLFIPEIYINIMAQTKNLPCKRIVLLQNTSYLCDTMAIGGDFENMKIYDSVTTSEGLEKRIKEWFPSLRTNVVHPSISDCFTSPEKPKKMIVNILTRNSNEMNNIIKPFCWKYPHYKWVTFMPIKELSRKDTANALKEGSITLWLDYKTDFGYGALESMACKNIVIGKVPENEPDWLLDENSIIKDNGLWFYKNETAVDMLASAIETVLNDAVPQQIYDEMALTTSSYTYERQVNDVKRVYVDTIFKNRYDELELSYKALTNNDTKETEE